jgi:hypothetical protein
MPCYQDITTCLSFEKWYNSSQYGLQAFGEEATKLYNEVYKCIMCGRPPRMTRRSVIVEEKIDGRSYIFDTNGCALIFRKLKEVNGKEAFQ